MQINYKEDAFGSLIRLVNNIESTNTQGAGLRWLNRHEMYLKKTPQAPEQIKLCNNATCNRLQLRCLYFNEWVIAFLVNNTSVLIEALLHKSRISK